MWSPARRANPGIEPRARGPATGDPRLRALPASRHRTRIGHRTRARCPNLLQRRPRTPRTADRTPEPCGFTSTTRTPQRPLWQIWTTTAPSTIHSPAARDPQRARTRPIPRTGFSRRVRNEPAPATAPTTGRGGSAGGPAPSRGRGGGRSGLVAHSPREPGPRDRAGPGSLRVAGRRAVDGRGGGGCPNLPQRPLRGSGGRGETAWFRGSVGSAWGARAPLQQIWTSCASPVSDSGPVSARGEGPEPGVSGRRAACARLDPRIGATSRAPQAGIPCSLAGARREPEW